MDQGPRHVLITLLTIIALHLLELIARERGGQQSGIFLGEQLINKHPLIRLGFHPLLLPTFVLEFVPLADMLPSWTVCVAIIVAVRKRQQSEIQPPLPPGPVIDI